MSDVQERYAGAVMNTFGPPVLALARGEGAHVWDADGKEYVDLLGGIAVNALGHAHPALVEAVTTQLRTLGHVSNFFATEPQVALAERLVGLLGWSDDARVFFSNSGAEANEAALKLTRRTGRTRLVAAEGSFHGRTMGALALTSKAAYREPFEPLPGDVTFVPYDDVAALEAAVDDTVAAVVLEPIQGEAGVVVPSADYLAAAQRIAHDHGALLWLDEVQTGVARTGAWFAHQLLDGVQPDVVTLAKGLGGGIPIGATVARGDAATLLQPGNHGTTFGGNPVATRRRARRPRHDRGRRPDGRRRHPGRPARGAPAQADRRRRGDGRGSHARRRARRPLRHAGRGGRARGRLHPQRHRPDAAAVRAAAGDHGRRPRRPRRGPARRPRHRPRRSTGAHPMTRHFLR